MQCTRQVMRNIIPGRVDGFMVVKCVLNLNIGITLYCIQVLYIGVKYGKFTTRFSNTVIKICF